MGFVRRMSVHDLSEDASQELDRGKQSSSLENVIGAEGNQPLELQFNADKEDSALGQLDANRSRTRRARSLTEKGRRYRADILLEKRKRAMSRMFRKAKAIDDLLYSAGNQVAIREEHDQYSVCLSWSPITMKNIVNYWMLRTSNMKKVGLMILTKTCLTLSTEYTVG